MDDVNRSFFAADLTVLGSQHWHLVRIDFLVWIIAYDRFHRLLVVLSSIIAVDMIALDIHQAGTLAKFATDFFQAFLQSILVEARRPILLLHLG